MARRATPFTGSCGGGHAARGDPAGRRTLADQAVADAGPDGRAATARPNGRSPWAPQATWPCSAAARPPSPPAWRASWPATGPGSPPCASAPAAVYLRAWLALAVPRGGRVRRHERLPVEAHRPEPDPGTGRQRRPARDDADGAGLRLAADGRRRRAVPDLGHAARAGEVRRPEAARPRGPGDGDLHRGPGPPRR